MTAAVYYGPHDVRIERRPVPERGDGEALLRVLRSGMCGTDATEWKSGPHLFPGAVPHPVTGVTGPFIPGHEFIGEVIEVGESSRFSVGDLVASGAGVSCGHCARCIEGRTNLCFEYYTLGLNINGGMAEYVSAPEKILLSIPDGMSADVAGLAQPLAVGIHAASRSDARDGDRIVLIGAGAIGTFVLAGLRALVDADITVVDFPGPRLDRALRVGADRILPAGDDLVERVKSVVSARGADVVIEASGAPGQFANALALVRSGGVVLQVGLPGADPVVPLSAAVVREVSVRSTNAHVFSSDLPRALEILRTTDLGAEMLDSVHPLEHMPAQLELLATGKVEGKILFDPTQREG